MYTNRARISDVKMAACLPLSVKTHRLPLCSFHFFESSTPFTNMNRIIKGNNT